MLSGELIGFLGSDAKKQKRDVHSMYHTSTVKKEMKNSMGVLFS